jgi:hypothetical protein
VLATSDELWTKPCVRVPLPGGWPDSLTPDNPLVALCRCTAGTAGDRLQRSGPAGAAKAVTLATRPCALPHFVLLVALASVVAGVLPSPMKVPLGRPPRLLGILPIRPCSGLTSEGLLSPRRVPVRILSARLYDGAGCRSETPVIVIPPLVTSVAVGVMAQIVAQVMASAEEGALSASASSSSPDALKRQRPHRRRRNLSHRH